MIEWVQIALDMALIAIVAVGVYQAIRLIRQLSDLRAGRQEMDRFVRDFNVAVMRAEAGIKGLRAAARESGDDLEKLIEKAIMVRDELNFIVESADSVAERLSSSASGALSHDRAAAPEEARTPQRPSPQAAAGSSVSLSPDAAAIPEATPPKPEGRTPSRAEKELLQALKKLS